MKTINHLFKTGGKAERYRSVPVDMRPGSRYRYPEREDDMEIISELYRTVECENLAVCVGSGDLPVLATPAMIAWMEEASCQIAATEPGWTTVGISMDVSHDAPSALKASIRVQSVLKEQKGKIYTFEVSAYDGEKCIGKGVHKRCAVNREKFMAKLNH